MSARKRTKKSARPFCELLTATQTEKKSKKSVPSSWEQVVIVGWEEKQEVSLPFPGSRGSHGPEREPTSQPTLSMSQQQPWARKNAKKSFHPFCELVAAMPAEKRTKKSATLSMSQQQSWAMKRTKKSAFLSCEPVVPMGWEEKTRNKPALTVSQPAQEPSTPIQSCRQLVDLVEHRLG